MGSFSTIECFQFAWATFKKRPLLFMGATLLMEGINLLTIVPYQISLNHHAPFSMRAALYVGGYLISFLVAMGLFNFALKAHDDVERVSLRDLWAPRYYLNFAGTYILQFLIIMIGFILLIIPGIILMLIFFFPYYPVIERGLNPLKALEYSRELTKGHLGELGFFLLAAVATFLIGLIALIVGVLVALPVVGLAQARAYRKLQHLKQAGSAAAAVQVA